MSKRSISIAGVTVFLIAVFCTGFVFFYKRMQRSQPEPVATSKSLINKPFPHARLIDSSGAKVDEQVLRQGRVVVVFVTTDCEACQTESKFLQTVMGRRSDVTFYGLVTLGQHPDPSETAEKKFPFKVFYDEESSFVMTMGINRVPVKVFLEDGIIKKGWIGAALTDKSKTAFIEWLDSLP